MPWLVVEYHSHLVSRSTADGERPKRETLFLLRRLGFVRRAA